MAAEMRAMLDQLMGAERDVPLDERVNRKKLFTDEDVDKYFLCGFDVTMFKNTKSADEIARALRVPVQQASKQEHPCGVQSMELRAEFQVLTDRERSKYNYEKETKKILDRLVSDCDRRIRIATERVEMERAERARVYGMVPVHDKQALAQLADQTQCMQKKIEQLGIIGDVDGAEKAMKELDEIAERRKKLEEVVEKECERRVETMKRLIVCPLSGVFLNTHDNEQRVRDHQMGKQYLGWKRIRELKERLADILRKRAEGKGEENDRVYSKPLGKREDEEEEEEEDRAGAEAETEMKPPSEEKYRKVAVEEKEASKVKDEEKKTEKKKEALVVVKRRKIEKEADQKPEAPDEKNILSDVPPPPSSRAFDGTPAAGTTTTTTTTTTNNTTMTHTTTTVILASIIVVLRATAIIIATTAIIEAADAAHALARAKTAEKETPRIVINRAAVEDKVAVAVAAAAGKETVATLIDAAETLVAVAVTVLRNEDAIIPTEESTITTITTIVILKVAGASTTTTAAVLPGRPSRREIGETTVVIGERRETDLDLARQDEGNNKMLLDFICFNGASSSSRLSVKRFSSQYTSA
ncbi:unnamed protein product [Bathycoccus prasinos]